MTTLLELQSWLRSPDAIRCVLVEVSDVLVGASASTFYFSNIPYASLTQIYDSILIGGVSFNASITEDGSTTFGFGDLELDNTNGTRDSWIDYIWSNKPISIKIGDPRWDYSKFYTIFTGTIHSILSKDSNSINLIVVDILQKLDNPIQTHKCSELSASAPIPGSLLDQNKDANLPIVFGEVFGVPGIPTSNNTNSLEYTVSTPASIDLYGSISEILEVRDNGVPILYSTNTPNSAFNLTQSSYGTINASVQGYSPNIANPKFHSAPYIVYNILCNQGALSSRFAPSDISSEYLEYISDTPATYNSNTSLQQPSTFSSIRVGYYCANDETKLEICNNLLHSVGLVLSITSDNKIKLIQYNIPDSNVVVPGTHYIDDSDIELASLQLSDIIPPKRNVKLGFSKNYSVVSNIAASVADNTRFIFSDEWIIHKTVNTSANLYELPEEEAELQETYLISEEDAVREANRRLNLRAVPRKLFTFIGYAQLLPIELGSVVNMSLSRFGLSNTNGLVVQVDKSWISGRITIGVLV